MAQTEGSVILSKTYMARVPFKHNGVRYKSFDEIIPKDLNWTVEEVVHLVKAGRLMPFDTSLDAEVFYEIPLMQKRSLLGISSTDMQNVISMGKIDEQSEGINEADLKTASKLFSTHAYNGLRELKPTAEVNVNYMSFDAAAGAKKMIIPAGADESNTDELTTDTISVEAGVKIPNGISGSAEPMVDEEDVG